VTDDGTATIDHPFEAETTDHCETPQVRSM
jgi:hypothetical protein